MDRTTYEALKRIMERIGLHASDPKEHREDWLKVAAWMQEMEGATADVETLGTDDPRRALREVR